eukprot:13565530-Alexandrium_andersonii.AAC.1
MEENVGWNLRRSSPSPTPDVPPSAQQAFEADRATAREVAARAPHMPVGAGDAVASDLPGQLRIVPGWA